MKASAGVYISKLHKSDVRDTLHISVSSDRLDPCHKLTRDTGPVMAPKPIWDFKNLTMEDGNSKEVCFS